MTAQMPERLTYDGRNYRMTTQPLGREQLAGAKLQPNGSLRSDCWRGYVGSWEIKSDDMLYLTGLELKGFHEKSFAEMFEEATSDGLPATWVSGTLECTRGDVIRQDRFETIFEYETKFEIRDGHLVSTEEKKNEAR